MSYKDSKKRLRQSTIYYRNHPEKQKEHNKKWRKENPEKYDIGRSNHNLKKKHGITLSEYNEMFLAQGGVCAICGKPNSEKRKINVNGGIKRFNVDHDHKTGIVRGLLCTPCNRAIGFLKDDITIFEKAILYLKHHQSH